MLLTSWTNSIFLRNVALVDPAKIIKCHNWLRFKLLSHKDENSNPLINVRGSQKTFSIPSAILKVKCIPTKTIRSILDKKIIKQKIHIFFVVNRAQRQKPKAKPTEKKQHTQVPNDTQGEKHKHSLRGSHKLSVPKP